MSASRVLPRYPIYVPSKGRADAGQTMRMLEADEVPYTLVVEPHEADAYARLYRPAALLVLPWSGDDERRRSYCQSLRIENGGLIAARNYIKAHSVAAGDVRHWQLDDNIRRMMRWLGGKRITCAAGVALRVVEDLVDRYTNVALAGPNYHKFAHQNGKQPRDPFWLNVHVYSCTLVLNSLQHRWRLRYNDDTDMCLQVLADGWCTVSVNAVMQEKMTTMTVAGGNTDDLYRGDGRLRMARSLERMWPGVVETRRRFHRPQHVVKASWKKFDTPLRLRDDVDLSQVDKVDEYGMQLVQVVEPRSQALRELVEKQARLSGRQAREEDEVC